MWKGILLHIPLPRLPGKDDYSFLQDKSFGCAWDATKRVSVLWHTFAHLLMGAIEQARMLDRVMDNKTLIFWQLKRYVWGYQKRGFLTWYSWIVFGAAAVTSSYFTPNVAMWALGGLIWPRIRTSFPHFSAQVDSFLSFFIVLSLESRPSFAVQLLAIIWNKNDKSLV